MTNSQITIQTNCNFNDMEEVKIEIAKDEYRKFSNVISKMNLNWELIPGKKVMTYIIYFDDPVQLFNLGVNFQNKRING